MPWTRRVTRGFIGRRFSARNNWQAAPASQACRSIHLERASNCHHRDHFAELAAVIPGYSEEIDDSAYEGVDFLAKPYSADQVARALATSMQRD